MLFSLTKHAGKGDLIIGQIGEIIKQPLRNPGWGPQVGNFKCWRMIINIWREKDICPGYQCEGCGALRCIMHLWTPSYLGSIRPIICCDTVRAKKIEQEERSYRWICMLPFEELETTGRSTPCFHWQAWGWTLELPRWLNVNFYMLVSISKVLLPRFLSTLQFSDQPHQTYCIHMHPYQWQYTSNAEYFIMSWSEHLKRAPFKCYNSSRVSLSDTYGWWLERRIKRPLERHLENSSEDQ